ncbi:MAG: class I SAM-dependent methyltransferase [Ruminococcaceae bacterium]|nr:class I SAM-dependent methyltransferase [Oscillospiraceae bacterium]
MSLDWIDPHDFSFDCLLLTERFQIRLLCADLNPAYRRHLATALRHHPEVARYFQKRCPERAEWVAELIREAPETTDSDTLRESELYVLDSIQDFVIYTAPELMQTHCPFIYGWDEARLHELADLHGCRVLDVGSGSGRLAFAAAKVAAEVYASEPVGTLREYLRDQIKLRGITNMRVCDGMADALPFPDNTFDVTMSGHVVGDDLDAELAELIRVTRKGGWILDCPGDQSKEPPADHALLDRGWEHLPYTGSFGAVVHRYRFRVNK